jgi:hypothetical protein
MEVDWPLAGFMAVGLLAPTLASRLLVYTARVSSSVMREVLGRRRRSPQARLIAARFDLGERSSL